MADGPGVNSVWCKGCFVQTVLKCTQLPVSNAPRVPGLVYEGSDVKDCVVYRRKASVCTKGLMLRIAWCIGVRRRCVRRV